MTRALLLGAMLLLSPVAAGADTLADAVRAAAASNPVLAAARARQDGLAETVEQARALGRLTAAGDAIGGYDRLAGGGSGVATISANLPIWTGGRVPSAVRAARNDVAAGGQELREVEAQVLGAVVQAYADLLLQQQAVEIADAQIALLRNQVAEAEARFRLGTGTQTDVMQLRAQVEGVVGAQALAQATLASAAARYRALVGRDPGRLVLPPGGISGLPATLEEARGRAATDNPLVGRATAAQAAAQARIGLARSEGTPEIGLGGTYGLGIAEGRTTGYTPAATAGLRLRVPILTGGLVSSRVRQASAEARAAGFDRDAAGREAIRQVDGSWADALAARDRAAAGERAVMAADRALAGVKAEYSLGLRSTLDILIADQSLRSAQLSLAAARSDVLVSGTNLLRAVGALTVQQMTAQL